MLFEVIGRQDTGSQSKEAGSEYLRKTGFRSLICSIQVSNVATAASRDQTACVKEIAADQIQLVRASSD